MVAEIQFEPCSIPGASQAMCISGWLEWFQLHPQFGTDEIAWSIFSADVNWWSSTAAKNLVLSYPGAFIKGYYKRIHMKHAVQNY